MVINYRDCVESCEKKVVETRSMLEFSARNPCVKVNCMVLGRNLRETGHTRNSAGLMRQNLGAMSLGKQSGLRGASMRNTKVHTAIVLEEKVTNVIVLFCY